MGFQELDLRAQQTAVLGSIEPMAPEADLNQPHVRGQDQLDGALELLRCSGRDKRVVLEVSENGAKSVYSVISKEQVDDHQQSTNLANGGITHDSPKTDRSRPHRRDQGEIQTKPKNGKPHDVRGFTGFYKGTFYRDGVSQKKRS